MLTPLPARGPAWLGPRWKAELGDERSKSYAAVVAGWWP